MNDDGKTKQQLIEELAALRRQLIARDAGKTSASTPSDEALLSQVVGRVRDEIWKMRDSQDVLSLLTAAADGLRALGVPFALCGVNIIDDQADPPSVVIYNRPPQGELHEHRPPLTEDSSLLRIWRGKQVAYRADLQQEDPYEEGAMRRLGFRSLVDVPFSHGTLAVSSEEPGIFSRHDLGTLGAIAEVLSEGFRRQQDLRDLEQRNRSLLALNLEQQTEYGLRERENAVRLRIASMEHPSHLWDVVDVIRQQLKELGVAHDSCSVQIVNQAGTDFFSVDGDRPTDWDEWLSGRRTMDGIDLAAGLSWTKSTNHAETYPRVIEV